MFRQKNELSSRDKECLDEGVLAAAEEFVPRGDESKDRARVPREHRQTLLRVQVPDLAPPISTFAMTF